MPKQPRTPRERALEAAEGYVMLEMPRHALRALTGVSDDAEDRFELHKLRGEALRLEEEYEAALVAFDKAHSESPDDVSVLLGMAWCYKRSDQLQRAIDVMEQAYRAAPQESIVLYNLACYFALDGNKASSLSWLGRALRMQRSLRKLIPEETDFDQLRHDPDFQLIAGIRKVSDVP
jgi:tetratricopeptide (TPR) repeat protein